MKTVFLLLVAFFYVFTSNAQTLVISNGEDTGTGWWTAGSAGSVDIWDNPSKDDVNNTDKAMTVWINNGDVSYTGGGLSGLDIDVNTYNAISVMIFKKMEGAVRLELQDGTQSYFVTTNYTTPGSWQKLTFPIPAGTGNIKTLLVAPHFEDYTLNIIPDGEYHRMWWDQIVAYNESTSSIQTESSTEEETVSTQVYSLAGRLLQTALNSGTINRNTLSEGTYLIKKTDRTGKSTIEKIYIAR